MHKHKPLNPLPLLLACLPLLTSCVPKQQRLATRLDAAKHTADLATAVRSKTAGADAAVLADMLGRLAEEARYYAERSDESYRAGMTCERIYESVKILTMNRRGKIIAL